MDTLNLVLRFAQAVEERTERLYIDFDRVLADPLIQDNPEELKALLAGQQQIEALPKYVEAIYGLLETNPTAEETERWVNNFDLLRRVRSTSAVAGALITPERYAPKICVVATADLSKNLKAEEILRKYVEGNQVLLEMLNSVVKAHNNAKREPS